MAAMMLKCDRACENREFRHKLQPVMLQPIITGAEYLHFVACIKKPIECLLIGLGGFSVL